MEPALAIMQLQFDLEQAEEYLGTLEPEDCPV
jgi:hypothetical protein